MQITFHPYILLPLVTLFIALVIVVRVWRYRTRPVAMIFLVMMLALAEWSLAVFLEHASPELPAKVFWIKMTYFGITTIPVTWLIFTLRYTNREKWLTRRNIAILAILPVVTLVMVWTNNIHHLMWKDIWLDTSLSLTIDVVTHNAWFWVYAIYAYSLLLLGTMCLFTTFLHSTGIYRKQVGAMLFAALVPWVANFLFIGGIEPFSVVDPTPLAFAITGVIFYWGLVQLQLLDIVPIAHKAIFTSIADGVIVLDTQHRIIELNPAAEYIFRCTSTDAIGQPLSRVLPEQAGLTELQFEVTKIETEIVLGEGKTQRYYRTFISPIHAQGRLNGHMLLLHDDTERRKAEIESRERARLEAELTERKRSEAALRQSEENLRSYLESAPDGVYLNDLQGIFLYGNKKAEEITGYTREELTGKTFLELELLTAKDMLKAGKLLALNTLGRSTGPDEFELARKDGGRIHVEINTTPIKQGGKVVVIGFVR
ncbi:MAG: PAS domain S-box protein, partial [Dehalococcoidia bacterium]|nr:PAS domain S-box protein [Dehalococcoidia bacterium]